MARLLATVDWPEALQADAEALIGVLDALSAALADDDVDTAAPLATEAHEVQHDLSHAAEHWLGERMGAHASDADDQDGHDDQEKVESEEQESSGSGTGG